MATATAPLTISRRPGGFTSFVVAAATQLFQGVFAALDGSHRLVAATDAAARRVVGLMAATADNSAGAAGDISGEIEHGLFLVNNSAANALTNAHIGKAAFIEDDNTVASSPGTNAVVAGIVHEVTSAGVWLWVGVPHIGQAVAPEAVTLTSTNGTAAAAADLAALKTEAEKIGDDVRALHAALKLQGLIK